MNVRPMTAKRWMIVIAVAALDFAVIAQCREFPTTPVEFVGIALLILQAPVVLLWFLFGRYS
jgi:hypothetical protein